MKNGLRAAAAGAAVAALLIAGCGSNPVPPPVVAHGVAAREPLMDPRPYGAADTAFGLDVLNAWCQADPWANQVLSPSSLASGLGIVQVRRPDNQASRRCENANIILAELALAVVGVEHTAPLSGDAASGNSIVYLRASYVRT